jgi:hypothetical protein
MTESKCELKPCPKCGNSAWRMFLGLYPPSKQYGVECGRSAECCHTGWYDTQLEADQAWEGILPNPNQDSEEVK